MTLDHAGYLHHLRTGSERFLAVLRDCDPAVRVPTCPDWSADDLLWHLARVQWFWGKVVEDRLQSVENLEDSVRPDSHDGLVAFFAERSQALQDALAAADPAEPTVGDVTALDAELASDGVEEVLRVMFGGCPPWGSFTPTDVHVHVEATDTGAVVPVVLGRFTGTDPRTATWYDDEEISVDAADPGVTPRATVRGPAADLDAWLWHRRDDSALSVEGDPEVIARVRSVLAQPLG